MRPAYPPALLADLPALTRANPDLVAARRFHLAASIWPRSRAPCRAVAAGAAPRRGMGPKLPARAHLRHFAVDPGSIGTGGGRALFQRCTAEARSAGAGQWQALASHSAEAFYARLGLACIDALARPLAPDCAFPLVRMAGDV